MSDHYIFSKVLLVIRSCKTSGQFKSAQRYADLFLDPLRAEFFKFYPGQIRTGELLIYEKDIFDELNGKCLELGRERINDQILKDRDLGLRHA